METRRGADDEGETTRGETTRRETTRRDGEGGRPNESRWDDDMRPRTMHGGERHCQYKLEDL
jgi:hypothetical protein